MNLEKRIKAFSELGERIREVLSGGNSLLSAEAGRIISSQQDKNEWFTPDNVRLALESIAGELTPGNLGAWTEKYPGLQAVGKPLSIGVVMAGNIPLAGFHDFLCVLISGNRIVARTSSKDPDIMVWIADLLVSLEPSFRDLIIFRNDRLCDFDAVIATGSDNTSRYFEYYFGKYPNIIRKNRNSVSIIDGSENESDLAAMGEDIFSYFGLGCRNISKIFVPEGYDLNMLSSQWRAYSNIICHKKYANNYDFSKAVFIVNREPFTDTGYLLMKESTALSSPVAVLFYEKYRTREEVIQHVSEQKDKIQCITGSGFTSHGKAQWPHLWDYADGIDTIDFLLKINRPGIL